MEILYHQTKTGSCFFYFNIVEINVVRNYQHVIRVQVFQTRYALQYDVRLHSRYKGSCFKNVYLVFKKHDGVQAKFQLQLPQAKDRLR